MAGQSSNVPITELFWSLVDKGDRRFSIVRDLPLYGRNRNDTDLQKAFRIYTQLWKMQQEHRQKLLDAGLRRWEIGEIASRIAQLYYGQYQRSSDSSYLAEAYIFYEAILTRDYFRDGAAGQQQDPALANKQLRFLARFLIVCLVLGRREMVGRLAAQLKALLEECKRNIQEAESKEWKHVVQEVGRFLKADTPFMNMRPLRYSFAFDPPPDSLPNIASSDMKRGLALSDAILCSYHHNEVKLTELTLDAFRMLQCLEWEPCGSFSTKSGADGPQNGSGSNHLNLLQDIRDPGLPPNPRKLILYRPSVTHFLVVLATICKELPADGILLIYLSAAGEGSPNPPVQSSSGLSSDIVEKAAVNYRNLDISSLSTSPSDNPIRPSSRRRRNVKLNSEPGLWLGSRGSEGSNYVYPCDLIPFTRKPLFLVIDSNSSHAFKAIHGAEKGETIAMLLSPRSPTAANSNDSARYQNGSQFTMFLTTPLQAFCFLIGISGMNIERETYNKAEELFSLSLNEWETSLVSSDALHPLWTEVMGDPFLRRLLLRFIFCRATLALFRSTNHQEEFLPTCLPQLPDSVQPDSTVSQSCVMRLATSFGATSHFTFTEGNVLSEPAMVKASDTDESHSSAANVF
ncbi:uncharacterized protein [Typha angustifolia]|uniref:uncharacterized protein n=1 Tax=Typha angustifolia TaxID=59011 RepID=UPI003C2E3DE7